MPQVGPAEILVILLVGLLVFGPKRLPEIGRQVGRAMREVKKFQDTVKGELDQVLHLQEDEDHSPPTYPSADAAIIAAEAPPALPAPPDGIGHGSTNGATNGSANGASRPDAEPAPRAQSATLRTARRPRLRRARRPPPRRRLRPRPRHPEPSPTTALGLPRASGLPGRGRQPDPRPWL